MFPMTLDDRGGARFVRMRGQGPSMAFYVCLASGKQRAGNRTLARGIAQSSSPGTMHKLNSAKCPDVFCTRPGSSCSNEAIGSFLSGVHDPLKPTQ